MNATGREKRTVKEILHALSTNTTIPPEKIRAVADVLGLGKTATSVQRPLTKNGTVSPSLSLSLSLPLSHPLSLSLPLPLPVPLSSPLPSSLSHSLPSQEDAAKFFLVNPELSVLWEMLCSKLPEEERLRVLEMTADIFGSEPASAENAPSSIEDEVPLTPVDKAPTTPSTSKKKRKKSKKKGTNPDGSNEAGNITTHHHHPNSNNHNHKSSSTSSHPHVLKPRNFLEAALYFSSITLSTVEMAVELEPEHFFAPPLLFSGPEGTENWLASLCKSNIGVVPFEMLKLLQRRTLCIFAVALLQSAQHLKPTTIGGHLDHRHASIAIKSNYLKRTIGLYAISLVDHLPPSLTCRLSEAEKALGPMNSFGNGHHLTQAQRLLFKNNPLLANRKLELNDLKVPSAQQISDYWKSQSASDKILILRAEQASLQKGWINVKKTWCLCKYCRTRSLRLGDIYELIYRCYVDDLERVALDLEAKKITTTSTSTSTSSSSSSSSTLPTDTPTTSLRPKMRKLLFKSLSLLADDISNERNSYLVMVLKRLGKAFEEDYSEWNCDNKGASVPGVCECCRAEHSHALKQLSTGGGPKSSPSPSPSPSSSSDPYPDVLEDTSEGDDDEQDHDEYSDSHDDDDLESFYEDFNMMEDEEIIQSECELPIDPAHLSTAFPPLYDPRLYSLPRPSAPATSEADRIAEGNILYEHLASLLFQFHLVPRYLEAEAIARQRRLLEEEEERERLEKERADQKAAAKQRKKEKQRAAKKRLKEESEAKAPGLEDDVVGAEVETKEAPEQAEDPEVPSEATAKEEIETMVRENTDQPRAEPSTIEAIDDASPAPTAPREEEKPLPDDLPPGLSILPPVVLTGEAPPGLPATWFDKILRGPLGDSSLESLWSPLATSVRPPPPPSEMPPGFGGHGWSPFVYPASSSSSSSLAYSSTE